MATDFEGDFDESLVFVVIVNPELDEKVGDIIQSGSISIDDITVHHKPH